MRAVRYTLAVIIGLLLCLVAFANRGMVEVRLLPGALGDLLPGDGALSMPLFVALLLALFLGAAVGFVWEWLRGRRLRAAERAAATARAEAARSPARAAGRGPEQEQDEVLALLESRAG